MDTSAEETVETDSLGRRSGPRTRYTIEEKLRIVQETHVRGASVATVARRYNLNANQVFAWRQLYRRGLLDPKAKRGAVALLPVKVSTPTVLPTESTPPSTASESTEAARPLMEIKLSSGHSVVLYGRVQAGALSRVIDLLVRT